MAKDSWDIRYIGCFKKRVQLSQKIRKMRYFIVAFRIGFSVVAGLFKMVKLLVGPVIKKVKLINFLISGVRWLCQMGELKFFMPETQPNFEISKKWHLVIITK